MNKINSIEEYIAQHPKWEKELTKLRSLINKTGLTETIKWGAPVYTYSGKNILGLGGFKNYAAIWFFQGALLSDPYHVLINAQEGKTAALRQWRFDEDHPIEEEKIRKYIKESIQNCSKGKQIKGKKKTPINIPDILQESFRENTNLKNKFGSFPPYKQREFCEYINDAKQEKTKLKRRDKIIPLILSGIGLNDKYRKC